MSLHDDHLFFDAFESALAGDNTALSPWLRGPTGGMSVYRNTIASGAIDALVATFSTVQLMTGQMWFRAAAREFARANPPSDPALVAYGELLPTWLTDFPPAVDTPYLAGVARLDWLWWQSWSAADAQLLDPAKLAALPHDSLSDVTLALHPTLRLANFATSIPSLWLAHQSPMRSEPHQLIERSEHILFIRTGPHVQSHLVDPATFAFLEALQGGASFFDAAECALAADPECSLPHILTGGVALGLFTDIAPIKDLSA